MSSLIGATLEYQPFWRNRMQEIWYVMRNHAALNPNKVYNHTKWSKNLGWGSRFPGWERALESMKPLEFNAMQWKNAVDAVSRDLTFVEESRQIQTRYEDLVTRPDDELRRLLAFIGVPRERIGELGAMFYVTSVDRWRSEFTPADLSQIRPILIESMSRFGYEWNA